MHSANFKIVLSLCLDTIVEFEIKATHNDDDVEYDQKIVIRINNAPIPGECYAPYEVIAGEEFTVRCENW